MKLIYPSSFTLRKERYLILLEWIWYTKSISVKFINHTNKCVQKCICLDLKIGNLEKISKWGGKIIGKKKKNKKTTLGLIRFECKSLRERNSSVNTRIMKPSSMISLFSYPRCLVTWLTSYLSLMGSEGALISHSCSVVCFHVFTTQLESERCLFKNSNISV